MTLSTDVTVNTILGTVNLALLVGLSLKGTELYGRFVKAWTKLVTKQEEHGQALDNIKQILGNGTPGTVVRVPTCIAMHDAVRAEIRANRDARVEQMDAIHEDIRSLHDAVRELHKR
jgi:hypothetical protein